VRAHGLLHRTASLVAGIAALSLLTASGRTLLAAGVSAAPATGRVHYRMSSPMMNGTTVISWIDHGHKFRQDSHMSIGATASKSAMQTWSIGNGADVYTYQPALGKQVLHMKVSKGKGSAGPIGGTPFVGNSTGKVIGKATVMGRPCEIRAIGARGSGPAVKMWVWNGLPLRTEMTLPQGGKMTTEATQVETAPKLAPALFKLPAGYTVKEFQMPAGALGAPPHPPR
jgi:hypothetical protein